LDKEFGKFSRHQLKDLYAGLHQLDLVNQEIASTIIGERDTVKDLLFLAPPWGIWYELPYPHHILLHLATSGLLRSFVNASRQVDPQQAVLDLLDSDPESNTESYVFDYDEEEQGILASLHFSIQGQIRALSYFRRSMSELIADVRAGNDDALFDAVLVDRASISAPSISRRIQMATLVDDETFLHSLSKAITRTRPRPPAEEYNHLRYLVEALDEGIGLENITDETLYNLFVEELELYPDEGRKDPYSGLKRLIQKTMKKSRT